ncbi:hypothetical protein HOLDEFILI_03423 [Holdemania filiformis DSM 12042]|uniref:Uncharacterized protein n=1 Tax=Holdemania filiformis DSM 12042 TaxID=545696 RepID=B9YC64_9FIRM|nr:hypothetical protein HOLDEFILI_03423 [Holdemania filiformis DSM 12042]
MCCADRHNAGGALSSLSALRTAAGKFRNRDDDRKCLTGKES